MANAYIYHYGHVRKIERMREKLNQVSQYWNSEPPKNLAYSAIDPKALQKFEGSHPSGMQHWLATQAEQQFSPSDDHTLTHREKKHRISMFIEKISGLDLSHKHFKLV